MVFVYFFMVGIIEIFAFILWKVRRKKIEKQGWYTNASILVANVIIGKPNRYRFEVEFYDMSDNKKTHKITVNGNIGNKLQQIGKIPIIYLKSSNKIYMQKNTYGETLLSIAIIIITFMFAFLCLG